MDYRHEMKLEINRSDMLIISQRLRAFMQTDTHSIDGLYHIRSLYFDTPNDKALMEKLNGVSRREKFRIRYYNGDFSFIRLEKKIKVGGLGTKLSARLSYDEAQRIVSGDTGWLLNSEEPLLRELYTRMRTELLQPKTIVDYTREPYIYEPGNVRITLDYDIRTGLRCTDFLNPATVTIPAGDAPALMEIKWDDFLPSIVRDAVNLRGRRCSAFSKYAQCRIYG